MNDFFFYYPRTMVNRNGVLLLNSTAVASSDSAVTYNLPRFRTCGRGLMLVNLLQGIPEGLDDTLPIVFNANGSTQALTKTGGEPVTVADIQGTGVYQFYYDSNAGILQLLGETSTTAATTSAEVTTRKTTTKV